MQEQREFAKTIEELIHLLQQVPGTQGILLHGSYARNCAVSDSDIDILWITSNGRLSDAAYPGQIIGRLGNYMVDIKAMSADEAVGAIKRPDIRNDNVYLNAFLTGEIVYDADGSMGMLALRARETWEQGPALPLEDELYQAYLFVYKGLKRLKSDLPGSGQVNQGIAKVLSAILFFDMVYGYCKSRGKWTSKLEYVIRGAQEESPDLYRLCLGYLQSKTPEEMIHSLEALATEIFSSIAEQLPSMMNVRLIDRLDEVLGSKIKNILSGTGGHFQGAAENENVGSSI